MIKKQIYNQTQCTNPKCDNKALMIIKTMPLCGMCVIKLNEKSQKMILEALK